MKNPHVYFKLIPIIIVCIGIVITASCITVINESTGVTLTEVTMTTGVDSEMKPIDPADVFDVNTKEIHCSAKLSYAPSNTKITAEWIYIKGVEDLQNYKIDEHSITTEGTRYIDMSLIRPYEGWPVGDYEVILSVNGAKTARAEFYVR
jgi:hypothetical protein